jgi:hypothetical protein
MKKGIDDQFELMVQHYRDFKFAASQQPEKYDAQELKKKAATFFDSCLNVWYFIQDQSGQSSPFCKGAFAYMSANRPLSLAHYIANEGKHRTVKGPVGVGATSRPRIVETYAEEKALSDVMFLDAKGEAHPPYGYPKTKKVLRLMVETDDSAPVPAVDLAEECINAWTTFFENYSGP